jgi:hypothetical protein
MESRIQTTELKHRILANIPELHAYKDGRDILLAYNKDIGLALKKVAESDHDTDAIHLAKAAKIVRKDMLEKVNKFNGTFMKYCQQDSVPKSLLALVAMILDGPSIKTEANAETSQSALSISQLLQFNSYKRRRESSAGSHHRNKNRETPLTLYIGMMIHAKTRNREVIDTLFKLGLSVAYDRVLGISTNLANAAV